MRKPGCSTFGTRHRVRGRRWTWFYWLAEHRLQRLVNHWTWFYWLVDHWTLNIGCNVRHTTHQTQKTNHLPEHRLQYNGQNWASSTEAKEVSSAIHSPVQKHIIQLQIWWIVVPGEMLVAATRKRPLPGARVAKCHRYGRYSRYSI